MKLHSRKDLDEDTPTRRDGVPRVQEMAWRRGYCQLIREAGMRNKIPPWVIGSACLFCHRFFMVKSMLRNDRFSVATAALLLASKVEESPKGLKALTETVLHIRFGQDPATYRRFKDPAFVEEFKEHVLVAERALLYTLGFDLNVSHPYTFVLGDLSGMGLLDKVVTENKQLMQVIFNIINDSYRTTVGLQYSAKCIACAALYMATFCHRITLPYRDNSFWAHFGMQPADIEDIINQLLEMYAEAQQSKQYLASLPFVTGDAEGQLHARIDPHAQPQQQQQLLPHALSQPLSQAAQGSQQAVAAEPMLRAS